MLDFKTIIDLQSQVRTAQMESISVNGQINNLVKESITKQVEEAKTKYNEIMSKENPEYTAVKRKSNINIKRCTNFC